PRRSFIFFFQAEDGIRDLIVTGVQTCALPIWVRRRNSRAAPPWTSSSNTTYRWTPARFNSTISDNFSLFTSLPCARSRRNTKLEIGRASCRERGKIWVVDVSFKKY